MPDSFPFPFIRRWPVAASINSPPFAAKVSVRLAWATTVLVAVGLPSCRREPPPPAPSRAPQDQLRQADRAKALLTAAANQLSDLPAATDIEMQPPTVVLDSRNSTDRQDLYAICVANPAAADHPVNVLRVATNNARFKGLAVRPGDYLKYFVIQDETVDEESRQIGMSREKARNLKVGHVIDDNTLLLETPLKLEVTFPAKVEVWRAIDVRQKDIINRLDQYATRRLPALGWEPAPDEAVMTQVMAWLNQWIRQSTPPSGWNRDALLDSLPADLHSDKELASAISAPRLAAASFEPHDGRLLQEAIWLRDISRWASGGAFDDLGRATALFDWTIRNIQLDADAPPHRPWHTLLYGRGTAEQRSWVFAGLCRQQGLAVVMVGIPPASPPNAAAGAPNVEPQPTHWLPALLLGNQLHLFDTRLGLPLAGPNGQGVVTLNQVRGDDGLLRKLDLEPMPYPVTAELAKSVRVSIVADPFELSRRAAQLEANLAGEDHLFLAVKPAELVAQLQAIPGVANVALWDFPFRTLQQQLALGKSARTSEALAFEPFAVRPTLWKARTRHFQGRRRPPATPGGDELDDHQEAVRLYMSKSVRPTDREIAASPSDGAQRVELTAKLSAAYWLGLMSYDDGKHAVAANWFARPELNSSDSPWAAGARYNLARSLESQQKLAEATALLEQDASPQQHGNKLRARELRSRPPVDKQEQP